jgi:hypothetical protein
MSNGLKVGILVVIAGALGFLGYSQFKKGSDNAESRPAETTAISTEASATEASANAGTVQNGELANTENGKLSETRAKTVMTLDKKEHDFGTIKQGDQVECAFKVTNTGTQPLILEEAHGSCGCTVPDYPKDPIPVGESREIKVKFNSNGKKGKQSKTVTITANTEPIQTIVTIHSMVDAPETDSKEKPKSGK